MKLGRIVAAAATSGLLLSGAFVVAEEYTGHNVFAVNLDNSNKIELKTKKGTVREILIANNIPFGADDRVEPGLDTRVNGGETINIYKAREITIVDGNTTTVRKTTYKKVEDILKELNITLGANDRVTPSLNSEVATVDTIKIVRDGKATEVKKEEIKFETKEEKDDSKYVDEKVTKVEGKNGEKEVTYNVVRENGKEISREVVSEKVLKEATAKVVVVGTKQRPAEQKASSQATSSSQSYSAQSTPAQSYSAAGGSVRLSNGNTAGATGAAAAQEMARRTGVPASTWEHIIARESNGQVGARNASGASGLFQTMPGWGSTATVQDQINAATRAYQAQGLSAWGM
jgi:probable transglycosylase isaA